MSRKHPIIAVTGSSGAGTPTVRQAFENLFRREVKAKAAYIEGASFHSLDRAAFHAAATEAATADNKVFSHFGPEANHFDKLEETFRSYGETGKCRRRYYIHTDAEATRHNRHFKLSSLKPGVFTPWEDIEADSDLLVYEGLHGLVSDPAKNIDAGKHVDFGIGVVPVVNLEWIQKIHRDKAERGYSTEATVDTSNPFITRDVPAPNESLVVIRFRDPRGVDFPYFLKTIHDSFMSRANTLVVPGGMMSTAMEIILGPVVQQLMDNRKR
jgi:phosphoribulokinase